MAEQVGDFGDLLVGFDPPVEGAHAHAHALGLAAGFPAHDESFVGCVVGGGGGGWGRAAVVHHSLAEDDEFDVPDDGDSAPGYWCGP